MNQLRRHGLAIAALCAVVACKKSEPATPPVAAPASASDAAVALPEPAKVAVLDAAPASQVISKPFFYRVEKNGKASHLLGTMHLGVDAEKRLPPFVWSAFAGARAFAMEANILDPSAIMMMMRKDGKTLDAELGPEYWAKVEAAVGEKMAAGLKGMKAAALVSLLEMSALPQTAPMDLVFFTRAKESDKQIVFLEELAQQAAVLEKWMDVRILKYQLDHQDQGKKLTLDGLAAYERGDDAVLLQVTSAVDDWLEMGRTKAEFEEMMDDVLYRRNAAWIAPLEKLLASGGAFVAVGAAHLIGPRSVVELLQAKGYQITRVEQ
jgi:uncharacterized protein YbaP (TraB family)